MTKKSCLNCNWAYIDTSEGHVTRKCLHYGQDMICEDGYVCENYEPELNYPTMTIPIHDTKYKSMTVNGEIWIGTGLNPTEFYNELNKIKEKEENEN